MQQSFEYQFEWDSVKERLNYRKHGISFERAAFNFTDPRALSLFDENHSGVEERWITLGLDHPGIPIVVCHTIQFEGEENKARVRIFSARRATKREIREYQEV